jgi:hypothetical protein
MRGASLSATCSGAPRVYAHASVLLRGLRLRGGTPSRHLLTRCHGGCLSSPAPDSHDLRKLEVVTLEGNFGKYGVRLHQLARGIDNSAVIPGRQLRAWVEQEIHLDLTDAPFDPQDETLLLPAGSCEVSEAHRKQPASVSRSAAKIDLVVKWNRFGKRFSKFDAPFGPSSSLCLTGPFRSEGLRSRRRSV